MRPLFVNLLAIACLALLVLAGFAVHPALGYVAAAFACGVLYLALSDGKGLGS